MRSIMRIVALVLVGMLPVLLQPVSARAAGDILDQSQTGGDTIHHLVLP